MRKSSPVLTVEAAITDGSVFGYLTERAAEYQRLLRDLHLQVNCRGQDVHSVVKQMIRTEGWSTRQLNPLRIELDAMSRAWLEGMNLRIEAAKKRISRLEGVMADEQDKNARHQRKRKLIRWQAKLSQRETELKRGKPRLCFGGRVHLIFEMAEVTPVSNRQNGTLGIDQNPGCIACAQIKPDGNLERILTFDLPQDKPTEEQSRNEMGQIVARIVTWAAEAKLPIVIERLDFPQLQKELKSRGLNRRLSRFKFGLFQTMLHTRAAKAGVEVIEVTPAYTSIIGYFKFGYGNGLNRHESAAIAIARRIMRPGNKHFSERIRFRTQHPEAPDPKPLRPPVTDGRRHPWRGWRRLGSLLAKNTQNGKTRSKAKSAGDGSKVGGKRDQSRPVARKGPRRETPPNAAGPVNRSDPSVSRTVL